ncbi:PREDICTED: putative nuclease HARBI1 [Nanorana parkeri]|uniref:putative nuclease HARBI1 n=1 Tax=Nanorana parkeri TaxID=125878 RepID=UPI0008547730|nr:PREDICTED: putative nuclease HARBI1 [Nanorana parkeri]
MSFVVRRKARAALAIAMVNCYRKLKKHKRHRAFWTKDYLATRDSMPQTSILPEIRENDPDDFRNLLKMSDENFNHLLRKVTPLIQKQDTCMRKSISAEQRLVATLRFLATGRSLEDLKFSTAISPQALGVLIPETCHAIIQVLKGKYFRFPATSEDWHFMSSQFEELWNFPNCGGAIDGRHVRINPPHHSGSMYYNYKGFFSIVVMAIVNANCEFIMVDVGKNGKFSDGAVIEQTHFYEKLKEKQLKLPDSTETKEGLNFVFVTDEAFALDDHILRPYSQKAPTRPQKIFNYRLARARRVAENAFGLLSNRFRIFRTTINLSPHKIELVVMACCLLHNFLRRCNADEYSPVHMLDRESMEDAAFVPGDWRSESAGLVPLQSMEGQKPDADAKLSRQKYTEHFNGAGAVEWQEAMVENGVMDYEPFPANDV